MRCSYDLDPLVFSTDKQKPYRGFRPSSAKRCPTSLQAKPHGCLASGHPQDSRVPTDDEPLTSRSRIGASALAARSAAVTRSRKQKRSDRRFRLSSAKRCPTSIQAKPHRCFAQSCPQDSRVAREPYRFPSYGRAFRSFGVTPFLLAKRLHMKFPPRMYSHLGMIGLPRVS